MENNLLNNSISETPSKIFIFPVLSQNLYMKNVTAVTLD
jgi:hypothetical protein